ncbi:MAG: hypothetical protein LBP54_02570 [Campylobacteraceae bacterium]|jgi:hypothetical protein|nr:hypothetical protein [Campylobacteraceae bacterium]
MATPYEIDLLSSAVFGANGFISARIPEEEQDNNEDIKKLDEIWKFVSYIIENDFGKYIDYDFVIKDVNSIMKKYWDMPYLSGKDRKKSSQSAYNENSEDNSEYKIAL